MSFVMCRGSDDDDNDESAMAKDIQYIREILKKRFADKTKDDSNTKISTEPSGSKISTIQPGSSSQSSTSTNSCAKCALDEKFEVVLTAIEAGLKRCKDLQKKSEISNGYDRNCNPSTSKGKDVSRKDTSVASTSKSLADDKIEVVYQKQTKKSCEQIQKALSMESFTKYLINHGVLTQCCLDLAHQLLTKEDILSLTFGAILSHQFTPGEKIDADEIGKRMSGFLSQKLAKTLSGPIEVDTKSSESSSKILCKSSSHDGKRFCMPTWQHFKDFFKSDLFKGTFLGQILSKDMLENYERNLYEPGGAKMEAKPMSARRLEVFKPELMSKEGILINETVKNFEFFTKYEVDDLKSNRLLNDKEV